MTHLDEKELAAKAWADLEFAASAPGALEVANVTLPIEKVRALVNERSALPSSPVSELVERLRGIYRIPITDGLGPAGGEEPDNPNEFVRQFETSPIQHEAADRLLSLSTRNAELEREVKRLREFVATARDYAREANDDGMYAASDALLDGGEHE